MAFFLGDVNGENAHDSAGEAIGQAGQKWAEEHVSSEWPIFFAQPTHPRLKWRIEDMEGEAEDSLRMCHQLMTARR